MEDVHNEGGVLEEEGRDLRVVGCGYVGILMWGAWDWGWAGLVVEIDWLEGCTREWVARKKENKGKH